MKTCSKLQTKVPQNSRLRQTVDEKLKAGIPVFELIVAVYAVAGGTWFAKWFLKLLERSRHWVIGIDDHARWRQYWNDPLLSVNEAIDLVDGEIGASQKFREEISWIISCAESWDSMTVEERRQLLREVSGADFAKKVQKITDHLMADLDDTVVDAYWDQERIELDLSAEIDVLPMLFVARVYFPCIVRYGQRPDVVLDLAIAGDSQAIERVLELDPAAEAFPELAAVKNTAIRAGKISLVEQLTGATFRHKPRAICGNSLKYLFASCVMHLVDALAELPVRKGRHLRKADLHDLYDALAIDRSRGRCRRDQELVGKESFARKVNEWKKIVSAAAWDFFEVAKVRAAS